MMSEIKFDEPTYGMPNCSSQQRDSFIVRLVLKLGLAKDKNQVNYVLLIIAVLAAVITFLVWPSSNNIEPQAPYDPLSNVSNIN